MALVKREFTAVIKKRGRWFVAWVEEIPGVNTQGRTRAEARKNLREALCLMLDTNVALLDAFRRLERETNRSLARERRTRHDRRKRISLTI